MKVEGRDAPLSTQDEHGRFLESRGPRGDEVSQADFRGERARLGEPAAGRRGEEAQSGRKNARRLTYRT